MHRYRRQAHNAAWYDNSGDAPGLPPIPLKNPFANAGGSFGRLGRYPQAVSVEEIIIRRHSRSRSLSHSDSESVEVQSRHRSPSRHRSSSRHRRETIVVEEQRTTHPVPPPEDDIAEVIEEHSPVRRESRRETIVVEERRTTRPVSPPEDDIVEVIEEHSPVRRPSKRMSGFRVVDPSGFGGGHRPMRKVSRRKTTMGERPGTRRQSSTKGDAIVEVPEKDSPVVRPSSRKSTGESEQESGLSAVAPTISKARKGDEAIDDSTSEGQGQKLEVVPQRLGQTTRVDLEACATSAATSHVRLNVLKPYLMWLPFWRQEQETSDSGFDLLASHLDAADKAFEVVMACRKAVAVLRFDLHQRSVRPMDAQLEMSRNGTANVSAENGTSEGQPGPGLNFIYALDSDDMCDKFLDQYFLPHHSKNETWIKFRQWAATSHTSRGGKKKVRAWKSFTPREPRSASFAFGFEHPGPFVTTEESQSSVKLIQAVHDAKRHGVYSTSRFSKFENHRRTVFIDLATRSVGDTHSCERTVIVSQNRPCHLEGSQPTPIDLTDLSIWKRLINETDHDDDSYYSWDSDDDEAPAITFEKENLRCFRILKGILFGVVAATIETWNVEIDELDEQFAALEARVYANPSDDAQAADLWSLSKHLLGMQQSILAHVGMIQSMQDTLNKYAYDYGGFLRGFGNIEEGALWRNESREQWLEVSMDEMTNLAKSVEEDQIQHAGQMIDLLYKSVSIRDARLSLDLNASLWRLSWITFIFLPLTFLVGFFGMNVSIFVNNGTSLKWYFVAAVPLMVVILTGWLLFKHFVSRKMNKNRLGKDFQEKKDN